jgi:hypothetical protein
MLRGDLNSSTNLNNTSADLQTSTCLVEDSSNDFNNEKVIVNKSMSDNFEFSIGVTDLIFVLTRNNSIYPNSINNMISKSIMIKALTNINLDALSLGLTLIKIEKLNIIDINDNCPVNIVNVVKTNSNCLLNYIEINPKAFTDMMLLDPDFLEKNKYTLYILRKGSFFNMKALFSKIQGCDVNVCRGASQKSHLLSPLTFRLSSYLMAIFDFNYKNISYLNAFSDIGKDKYLPLSDNFKCRASNKTKVRVINKKGLFQGIRKIVSK